MPVHDVYLSMKIHCAPDYGEALGSFLFDLGAVGVEEADDSLIGYFPGDRRELLAQVRHYLEELEALGHDTRPDEIVCTAIANRDWNAEWKKSYTGFVISDRIYIKPTWEDQPSASYPCLIEIDPEMAFGTGTHATTRLCLLLLEERLRPGFRVLDIGTGTGILAIAAAKLGAGAIVAFDVDPIAAETAGRNAAANGVAEKIEIFAGQLSTLAPQPFDLILANIHRTEIVKMLPLMRALFLSSAEIIFSGILREEEDVFRAALAAHRFEALKVVYGDEWLACLAR
jgi:ribosomal protein L11 methyltransferase